MFKTIIKKAKSWHFLRSSRKLEIDHPVPPIPLSETPLIVVSNPQGRRIGDLDEHYKESHPFHRLSKQELEQTPLPDIFPNLFYKERK